MGEMVIEGKAEKKLEADTTVIRLAISDLRKKYDEAVKAAADNTRSIKSILIKCGIEENKLKTSDLRISAEYTPIRNSDGNKIRDRFDGYRLVQNLIFRFPIDNDVLGKVLFQTAKCECAPRITLSFESSKMKDAEYELLADAVKDARRRADILAEAAGCKVTSVLNIDPDGIEPRVDRYERNYDMCYSAIGCAGESYDVDIDPEDLVASREVAVTFKFE